MSPPPLQAPTSKLTASLLATHRRQLALLREITRSASRRPALACGRARWQSLRATLTSTPSWRPKRTKSFPEHCGDPQKKLWQKAQDDRGLARIILIPPG